MIKTNKNNAKSERLSFKKGVLCEEGRDGVFLVNNLEISCRGGLEKLLNRWCINAFACFNAFTVDSRGF